MPKNLYSLKRIDVGFQTHVPTFSWYETSALKATVKTSNLKPSPWTQKDTSQAVFVAKGEKDTFDNFLN